MSVQQIILCPLFLRDVAAQADESLNMAIGVAKWHFGCRNPALCAVIVNNWLLTVEQRRAGMQYGRIVRGETFGDLLRKKIKDSLAHNLIRRVQADVTHMRQ